MDTVFVNAPWGCAATMGAIITATKGNASLALNVTLNVAAGDAEKPLLALVDQSIDGKKVSASQITIECEATGISKSATFKWSGGDDIVFFGLYMVRNSHQSKSVKV